MRACRDLVRLPLWLFMRVPSVTGRLGVPIKKILFTLPTFLWLRLTDHLDPCFSVLTKQTLVVAVHFLLNEVVHWAGALYLLLVPVLAVHYSSENLLLPPPSPHILVAQWLWCVASPLHPFDPLRLPSRYTRKIPRSISLEILKSPLSIPRLPTLHWNMRVLCWRIWETTKNRTSNGRLQSTHNDTSSYVYATPNDHVITDFRTPYPIPSRVQNLSRVLVAVPVQGSISDLIPWMYAIWMTFFTHSVINGELVEEWMGMKEEAPWIN